ncbi:MAG: hypothetical protein CMP67_02335 [Flavobacteriales bacterium]|mgnify:CR=1 FL=1|nr:hypothetical protein [Flavobacteriales bacterium]
MNVQKVKKLIEKNNDILLNSMSIALSEDLINLIVVNGDDKDFELLELVKDKQKFRALVVTEFLKLNSNSVLDDLKLMDDDSPFQMIKNKNQKNTQKRLDF